MQVVSRRDCGRGDTVVVNGARHTLDLVALIAYFKLKKKCQGQFVIQSVMAVCVHCCIHLFLFAADHNFPKRLSELVYLG